MKIHLLYSWINLRGANPHYRNNLYKITYVINFSKKNSKSGGVQPPYFGAPG